MDIAHVLQWHLQVPAQGGTPAPASDLQLRCTQSDETNKQAHKWVFVHFLNIPYHNRHEFSWMCDQLVQANLNGCMGFRQSFAQAPG